MVELLAKIYKAEGWQRKAGESRAAWANALYDIRIDSQRSRFVATKKIEKG